MNWPEIILSSSINTSLFAGLYFVFKEWVSARIKESIADEYKKLSNTTTKSNVAIGSSLFG
ncbi:MAG: hypothetical protein O7C75_09080 [Verrucomicrobia bacterium]|nr:hypothetical protein [Verrucomicrobiota bacterium]